MNFEDLYKKNMLFKEDMFFPKNTAFFSKKAWQKKHMFFMVDKTKQKLLFQNYECFSKKEKNVKSLSFAKDICLDPLWVQV